MRYQLVHHELQNVISGKSGASYDPIIQTALGYLRGSSGSSQVVEGKFEDKEQEATRLIQFAEEYDLLLGDIPEERFVSSGAEQRVYIVDDDHVLKLNDGIYYASWRDYLHNLLLHNYFFNDTAYTLKGFCILQDTVYAVVRQPFVRADSVTELQEVKKFLIDNGFENHRYHDYRHRELGLILEDLHDENVLTANGMLHFIDTVFYIVPNQFWK